MVIICYEYNCSKEKNLINNTLRDIQNTTFFFRVNAIIATLASKACSLIEDVDTNVVERFNSVIAKLPPINYKICWRQKNKFFTETGLPRAVFSRCSFIQQ